MGVSQLLGGRARDAPKVSAYAYSVRERLTPPFGRRMFWRHFE